MFLYHLAIYQWRPNFRKNLFKQEKMFIWIQFSNLPIEYINGEALVKFARAIERPIKMDIRTSGITRGRYARVCIEVDTRIPLPTFIRIKKIKQEVAGI